jgi:hypothetical protein
MSVDLCSLKESTIIDIIVSAKYYVKVSSDFKEEVLCLISPLGVDRLYSEFLYEGAYKDAIDSGLLPREELEEILKKRGLITEKEEERERDLVKQIKAQQTLFDKMRFAKNKKEKVGENIARLKLELSDLRIKFNGFYSLTAESIATELKINYLCWSSCHTVSGDSKFWNTYEEFNLEKDLNFRASAVNTSLTFLVGFSEKVLRKLARSSEWRIRYVSSVKAALPMFSRKSEDYTKDQLALVYWSNFYQSVYEMLSDDRPTDDIIESDALLDVYMEEYYKGLEQDRLVSGSRRVGTNAFDSDEVVVTRFSELYDKLDYDKPKEAVVSNDATDLKTKRSRRR